MARIKKGDLVRMGTGTHVGIVVGRHPKDISARKPQIGIIWIGGSGKVDWEPEPWLEVISESR